MKRYVRPWRGWLAGAIGALLALVVVGCGGGSSLDLEDVALSSRDVPSDWVPADLSEEGLSALWDLLPDLLASNADARLVVTGLQDESGLHGVATILIQTDKVAAIPQEIRDEGKLAVLSRLLAEQDALLGPPVLAGDPGAYFSGSDVPIPGSVRSRLVRLVDSGYLFSDSVIFAEGPVLVVVTVWYPEEDDPLQEVNVLAGEVEQRLRIYLEGS